MACSSGSLETSANSNINTTAASSFSFTNQFNSNQYYSLMAESGNRKRGFSDRIPERNGGSGGGGGGGCGGGVPKFKSVPPPSLPIADSSLSCVSPSSYFALPPGLSPSELLDSPVLLSSSYILPSPTTGSFPFQDFIWKNNSNVTQNQQVLKEEKEKEKENCDFSFQTQTKPATLTYHNVATSQAQSISIPQGQQKWNHEQPEDIVKSEFNFSPEISTIQTNNQNNGGLRSDYNQYNRSSQIIKGSKKSDDGYNWRKYGQKQVKASENPRSYYKCTFPNCPTKKILEIRSSDGVITEIVYRGTHNHPKPQCTRRSSSSSLSSASSLAMQPYTAQANEVQEQSYVSNGSGEMDSFTTLGNSCISIGDDDFEQSSLNKDDLYEDEHDAKRWKNQPEGESEGISAPGSSSRTVKEPRVVIQTRSDIDILDDGYRWRKYGQKVVKGNHNPRNYYKCTYPGCSVRKHVERAGHDIRFIITAYEGKHNHDVPAARGSGGGTHLHNRPIATSNDDNAAMEIQPQSNYQPPYTLEMLQSSGNFGYVNNETQDNVFSRAKDEPRDDMFFDSLPF